MDRQGLLDAWRERLDDYAQSEMTVQEWCDFNRVSIHQYYYWRRRIAALDAEQNDKRAIPSSRRHPWLPLDVVEPPQVCSAPGGVTVRIAGAAIEMEAGFDPALLRAVVRALGTDPC